MSMEVGRIDLGLDVNQNYFNRQLRGISSGAEKSVMGAFGGLGKTMGIALGVAAVASFTKSCLDLGSSLTEVQNVVDTTFTSMADQVNAFANSAIDNFGLSETVAKKYMGTLGTMSKSMGMTESVAYDMAEAVTGLSGDVASFYNLSSDEAYTKLKSIWTGETESLKDLGIVMTQTALDQYAMNNGFGKTSAKMTEQEKLMLRFQYVMSGLSAAQGDFVKTSGGWANQIRVLSLRFDQLKATIGQGLINALLPVIKLLNGVIERLQVAANTFVDFTKVIFGIKEATGGSGSATGALLDGVTDSANAASGAIASANKQLAGFDKLNNVGSSDSDSSGGGSGVSIPSIEDVSSKDSEDKINNSPMIKLFEKMQDLLDPLKTSLSNLWNDSLKPLATFTGGALVDFYDEFLKPLGTWVLSEGLPKLVDALNNLLKKINWDKLSSALEDFWGAIEPLAEEVGKGFVDFVSSVSEVLGDGIAIAVNALATGISAVSKVISKIDPDVAHAVGTAIGAIGTSILAFKTATKLGEIFKSIGGGLKGMISAIGAHPYLAAATAAIGIIVGLSDFLQSKTGSKEIQEYATSVGELCTNIDTLIQTSDGNLEDISNTYESVKSITDKYYVLADNFDTLTTSEKELMKSYAEEIVKKVPALADSMETATGLFTTQKEEVYKAIQAAKDYAITMAAQDVLIDYGKEQINLNQKIAEGKRALQENIDKMKMYTTVTEDGRSVISGSIVDWNDANSVLNAYNETLRSHGLMAGSELTDNYNILSEALGKQYIEQDKLDGKFKDINTIISSQGKLYDELTTSVNDASKDICTETDTMSTYFETGIGGMSKVMEEFVTGSLNGADSISAKFAKLAPLVQKDIKEIMDNISGATGKVTISDNSAIMKAPNKKTVSIFDTVPHLATGGFVKANTPQLAMIGDNRHQGEVVAPEGKLLEMAIAAAKASGSSKENLEMISILRDILNALIQLGDKELIAKVLSSDIFNSVKNEAQSFKKKTGKPAFV